MTGYINFASSSEDEFPDLDVVFQRSKQTTRTQPPTQESTSREDQTPSPSRQLEEEASRWNSSAINNFNGGSGGNADAGNAVPSTVRRRKLGAKSNNPLLKPLGALTRNEGHSLLELPPRTKRIPSVSVPELRARRSETLPTCAAPSQDTEEDTEDDATNDMTEITEADISEFFGDSASDDDGPQLFGRREESVSKTRRRQGKVVPSGLNDVRLKTNITPEIAFPVFNPSTTVKRLGKSITERKAENIPRQNTVRTKSASIDTTDDVADALRHLEITSDRSRTQSGSGRGDDIPPTTPPQTSPKPSNKRLVSPKKLPGIPKVPHRPSTDMFWSQEFVDEWNEEHSPKKLTLPPAQKSPTKSSARPKNTGIKTEAAKQKETKRSFEKRKHDVAQAFLHELDDRITEGKLQTLAESTGGIKINWSTKLNTTAGRANWRRETVRTKNPDGTDKSVTHRHHASIELAEKVIDDEHRLLNVVAHEFCHLANFMINNLTVNPHGKEFKAWAALCSRAFGDRGIEVTTKHSYEIDFKYIWACAECGTEFKRHSKSINPERHRCGTCKGLLKQIKPVPRASSGKAPSEYQLFFKEQMKLVKQEHPKSPQKEVMRIIADRWAKRNGANRAASESTQSVPISETVARLDDLELSR
ncbi:HMG box-containing protein C19G7.04 [Colletotrichum chlorophyti]|uniref:HMG box-containing protein C19G7.04 n=1 Tax=Colletotrichum chlorophyti TaxID=708187 RepID=A0A1Q8RTR5_9PEZI|nr:HMG box-containing protein C19G7.04 [Colletotrichum chlorophyti]